MASSENDKRIMFFGFSQSRYGTVGIGLDEGYTELLATRIFNKNDRPDAYHSLVKIAFLFEQFFENKEDMRKLYFSHDLNSLIDYMKQFAHEGDIESLIRDIDKLYYTKNPYHHFLIFYKIQKQLNEWFKNKITDEKRRKQFDNCRLRGIFYSKIDDDNIKKLIR